MQSFRLILLDHWYALCRLRGMARLDYLAQTVKAAAHWRLKALLCFGYHLIQRKPPADLLGFYIDEILFDRQLHVAAAALAPRDS